MDNEEDVLVLRKAYKKSNKNRPKGTGIILAVVVCMFLSVSLNTYIYLDIREK